MGDDPRRELITRNVERQIGGHVVSITQQPRWRPTWFLDLERKHFMELIATEKTQARIEHTLKTGKPLRN